MFRFLVILMIVVPALEIWGLLTIGRWIGAAPTFGLILLTGFIGAFLAKSEGRRVWLEAKRQLESGQIPGSSILDGICIFVGGVLLITPGFITDAAGFLLVLPPSRALVKLWMVRFISKQIRNGNFRIYR